MQSARTNVFARIEHQRQADGLSLRAFGGALGFSYTFWPLILTGRKQMSPRFARAIATRWPQFEADLARYFQEEVA
jgi:hypothetical protein